jgi:glycosyltransferase involved in cell wall biosynthesis
MGERAREMMVAGFSWNRIADQYLEVFHKVVGRASG